MHDHVQRDAAERACANLEAGSALKRRWNTKHNRTRIHRRDRTRVLLHMHYTRVYTIVKSKKRKKWMRSFSYARTHAHICNGYYVHRDERYIWLNLKRLRPVDYLSSSSHCHRLPKFQGAGAKERGQRGTRACSWPRRARVLRRYARCARE